MILLHHPHIRDGFALLLDMPLPKDCRYLARSCGPNYAMKPNLNNDDPDLIAARVYHISCSISKQPFLRF